MTSPNPSSERFKAEQSPDWGWVVVDEQGLCVAYFAYPDDPERRHYNGAPGMARRIAKLLSADEKRYGVTPLVRRSGRP